MHPEGNLPSGLGIDSIQQYVCIYENIHICIYIYVYVYNSNCREMSPSTYWCLVGKREFSILGRYRDYIPSLCTNPQ